MTQLVKVQNLFLSSDGYAAGEGQSLERPFGHADPGALAAWAGATASWPNRTDPGGSRGLDDYFTRDFAHNIGAEIMGRNKFGPQRGPWTDLDWRGWWGEEPPFHTPVFVMTHHPRPDLTLGETTFYFAEGEPAQVLPGRRRRLRAATSASAAAPRRSGRSSTSTWSTPCTSRSPRACSSVPASGSGNRGGTARPLPPRGRAERKRGHPSHPLASLSRPAPRPRRVVRDDADVSDSDVSDVVVIHTDGGCTPNPGPGGWGAVLRYGDHVRELCGGESGATTNNRMELMAPIVALETLKRPVIVHLYTDSTYVRNGIMKWILGWERNGWMTSAKQPVKNVDLWQRLQAACARHQVEWHWVKGHTGVADNELADQLATRGMVQAMESADFNV